MIRAQSQPPPVRRAGKTVVFNDAEWSRICSHLRRGEPEAQLAEQQLSYAAYLRDGSAAMTRHWTNSRRAQRDQQLAAKQAHDQAVELEGQRRCDAMVAGDEERRAERIAAAQRMIDRVQAGPRQLESAYLLADVLQTRQQQREQNARERCERKAQEAETAGKLRAASDQWLADHRERIMVRRRAEDGYKRELKAFVRKEREDRSREKNRLAAEEKRHRDDAEQTLAAEQQLSREVAQRKKKAEMQRVFEEIRGKREQENSECGNVGGKGFFLRRFSERCICHRFHICMFLLVPQQKHSNTLRSHRNPNCRQHRRQDRQRACPGARPARRAQPSPSRRHRRAQQATCRNHHQDARQN